MITRISHEKQEVIGNGRLLEENRFPEPHPLEFLNVLKVFMLL